jgi:hypothetical protein
MFIVLLPLTLAVVVGLAWTWVLTYRELRATEGIRRPQTIALLSELAVTLQALLFFAMAFFLIGPIQRRATASIAALEVLLFLIAVPCAILRKGPTRWFLAVSSVYFLALAGFAYLVSGIQF